MQALCWSLFLFFTLCQSLTVLPILRPNHPNPSGNCYIVYDDTQILIVDIGKEEADADQLIQALLPLTQTRQIKAAFVTHGHPDHVMAAWKLKKVFNGLRIFVGNDGVKRELVNLMDVLGIFLNASSPGNPTGNATEKFDYVQNIGVLTSPSQLWNGIEQVLVADTSALAETNHYAWVVIKEPSGVVHYFTGDIIYVKSHIFMGYDVSLAAQCDWLSILNYFRNEMNDLLNVTLYPGHGSPSFSRPELLQIIDDNALYINFCRKIYVQECDPQAATKKIIEKFPNYNEIPILVGFSAPVRVSDAVELGCNCSATLSCPNAVPPQCT